MAKKKRKRKAGSGKGKGSSFERKICKQLSLWVTNGARTDCFWRSSISGGRATVAHKKGQSVRQAGDITSVSGEGQRFIDNWFVECKHYRDLIIHGFLFADYGPLHNFWKIAKREAKKYDKQPMLIAKQNFIDTIVVIENGALNNYGSIVLKKIEHPHFDMILLKDLLQTTYQRSLPRVRPNAENQSARNG